MHVLKNAGNDIHLVVVREREDLEKRTVVKSSRENLVITDDADDIDEALEEAFTKQEVNEVHMEPEVEPPKVRVKIEFSLLIGYISLNVSYENLVLHRDSRVVDDCLGSHQLKVY